MIAFTVYSQFGIIPVDGARPHRCRRRHRPADTATPMSPTSTSLHNRSVVVEETILLLGLVTVGLIAWAEEAPRPARPVNG